MKLFCYLVLTVLASAANSVAGECMAKLDHCENSIEKQLGQLIKDRKVQQAAVCAKFTTFVECVGQLHAECGSLPKFRKNLCERRALKLSTYRYTWRYNFIYDLCHGSAPSGAAGGGDFFQHEKCISEVLNRKDWICDRSFSGLVRTSNVPQVCTHWINLRECSKNEVARHCNPEATNLSDYMFHTHGNYFSKYQQCHFGGGGGGVDKAAKCWIDRVQFEASQAVNTITTDTPSSTTAADPMLDDSSHKKEAMTTADKLNTTATTTTTTTTSSTSNQRSYSKSVASPLASSFLALVMSSLLVGVIV